LVPLLFSCIQAGTSVEYDAATKTMRFNRPWLGGPVEFSGTLELPDGTKVQWVWKSDVDLDPAANVRAAEVATIQRAVELAAEIATKAASGGGP